MSSASADGGEQGGPRTTRVCCIKRRQDVAGPHLVAPGALHMEDARLERTAEGQRLLRFLVGTPGGVVPPAPQEGVQIPAQAGDVGPARGEDLLALEIVGHDVQQVLGASGAHAGAPPLAVRDVEQHLDGLAEHGSVLSCVPLSVYRWFHDSFAQRMGAAPGSCRDRLRDQAFSMMALSGKPSLPRQLVGGRDLGLGDVPGEDAAEACPCVCTSIMIRKASAGPLLNTGLEDLDHELHRRVVVVSAG